MPEPLHPLDLARVREHGETFTVEKDITLELEQGIGDLLKAIDIYLWYKASDAIRQVIEDHPMSVHFHYRTKWVGERKIRLLRVYFNPLREESDKNVGYVGEEN